MAQPVIFDLNFNDSAAMATINRVASNAERRFNNIRVRSNPFKDLNNEAQRFDRTLSMVSDRFIAFAAATQLVYGLSNAFQALYRNAIQVEDALAQIQVNMKTTSQQMARLSSGLFQVASDTGQSFYQAADAAAEFGRQGLGLNKVLEATKAALVLTQTTGLAVEDSVRGLTVAVNTFQKEGLSYADVVNKMAEADTNFAVSSKDLVEFISRVGSAATDANISFKQTLAVATSLKQITGRTGSVLGNSFKSIITRLQRGRTRDVLEDIGVSTTNVDGSFKNQIDVLRNLAQKYEELSDAQKAVVSEQVGGVFQINAVKALFSDIGKEAGYYANVLKIVSEESDAAFGKSEFLANTASGSINKLRNSLIEMGGEIGKLGLNDAIKGISSELTGLANSFNSFLRVDGEDAGFKFGQSFVGGIIDMLAGPGLGLAVAAFAKLSGRIGGRFLKDIKGQFLNRSVNDTRERASMLIENNRMQQQAIKNEMAYAQQVQKGNAALQQRVSLMRSVSAGGMAPAAAPTGYKSPKGSFSSFSNRQLVKEAKYGGAIRSAGAKKELQRRGVLSDPQSINKGIPVNLLTSRALSGVVGGGFSPNQIKGAQSELDQRRQARRAELNNKREAMKLGRLQASSEFQSFVHDNPRAKKGAYVSHAKKVRAQTGFRVSSREVKEAERAGRKNRASRHMGLIGGVGAFAAFGGSMIGDAIGGDLGRGVSNVSQGAGTGAMLGAMVGPITMGIGAVAGGLYGLAETFKDSALGLRDLEEQAKKSAAAIEQQNAAFSLFEQGTLQLESILNNPNATPSQIRAANEKRASALGDASPELRAILGNAGLTGEQRRQQASDLLLGQSRQANLSSALAGLLTNADQNTSSMAYAVRSVLDPHNKRGRFNFKGEKPFRSYASGITSLLDFKGLESADQYSPMGTLRKDLEKGDAKAILSSMSNAGVISADQLTKGQDFLRDLGVDQLREFNRELKQSYELRKLLNREGEISNQTQERELNLRSKLSDALNASNRQGSLRSALMSSRARALGADFDMMSSQPGLSSSASRIFGSLSRTAGSSSSLFGIQQELNKTLNKTFEDFFEKADPTTRNELNERDPDFQTNFLTSSTDPTKVRDNLDKFLGAIKGLTGVDKGIANKLEDLKVDYQLQTTQLKDQIELEKRQLETLLRIEKRSGFNEMVQGAMNPANAVNAGIRNLRFNNLRNSFFNPEDDEASRRRNIFRDNAKAIDSRTATSNLERFRNTQANEARMLLELDAERRANGESGLSTDRLTLLQNLVLGNSRMAAFNTEANLASFNDGGQPGVMGRLSRMLNRVRHNMALEGGSIDSVISARDTIRNARLTGGFTDTNDPNYRTLTSLESNLQGSINRSRSFSEDSVSLLSGLLDFRSVSGDDKSANRFISRAAAATDAGDAKAVKEAYQSFIESNPFNESLDTDAFKALEGLIESFADFSSLEEGELTRFRAQQKQGLLTDLASGPSPIIQSQEDLRSSIEKLNSTILEQGVNASFAKAGVAIQASKSELLKRRNELESKIKRGGQLSEEEISFQNRRTLSTNNFIDELMRGGRAAGNLSAEQIEQFKKIRYSTSTGLPSGLNSDEFEEAIRSFSQYIRDNIGTQNVQNAVGGNTDDYLRLGGDAVYNAQLAGKSIYSQSTPEQQEMVEILRQVEQRLVEIGSLEGELSTRVDNFNVNVSGSGLEDLEKFKKELEEFIRGYIKKAANEPDLFNSGL